MSYAQHLLLSAWYQSDIACGGGWGLQMRVSSSVVEQLQTARQWAIPEGTARTCWVEVSVYVRR